MKSYSRIAIFFIFMAFILVAGKSQAQNNNTVSMNSSEYAIRITIINGATMSPVRNATITVDSLNRTYKSQVEGVYSIRLPRGNHTLKIVASGYQDVYQPVSVFDDGQFKLKMYRLIERKDRLNVGRYPVKLSFDNIQKRKGLMFGFGLGTGYSNHAASYTVRSDGFGNFKELSGYRLMTLNFEIGYGLSPKFFINYNYKYSPPNTTVSAYQSTYHGGELNFSPGRWGRGLITLGGGYQIAKDKEGTLADGYLVNAGLGYEVSPHFVFEMTNFLGTMNNKVDEKTGNRFMNTSTEFILQISINYLFY